jgi:hypothetical protein
MCNNPDLSAIEGQVKLLQEMLGSARITCLDFDNRENIHIIRICLDLAIDRMEKLK